MGDVCPSSRFVFLIPSTTSENSRSASRSTALGVESTTGSPSENAELKTDPVTEAASSVGGPRAALAALLLCFWLCKWLLYAFSL